MQERNLGNARPFPHERIPTCIPLTTKVPQESRLHESNSTFFRFCIYRKLVAQFAKHFISEILMERHFILELTLGYMKISSAL